MALNLDKDVRYVDFRDRLIRKRYDTVKFMPPVDPNTPQGLRELVRNQCVSFCTAFVQAFPELTLVKGFYGPFGTEHMWLTTADGTIIDPTSEQFFKDEFPPPMTHYEPWPSERFKARVGACPNCGSAIYEDDDNFGGVCSEECADAYSAYLMSKTRRY